MLTCFHVLKLWEQRFHKQGIDSPRLSAQLLLAHTLAISKMDLLLNLGLELGALDLEAFEGLAKRRLQGEPVAYLVGSREFYGLEFMVGPEVLIPRPETELIIDYLRKHYAPDFSGTILDIGTGSGALAVTCAHYFSQAMILATDLSWPALLMAQKNAVQHRVNAQILFTQGDFAQHVCCHQADIILANLPYVPERDKVNLSHEVVNYEPWEALFAGADGLDAYRYLALTLQAKVLPETLLLCEIGSGQGLAMEHLFAPIAQEVHILKDYSGHHRVVVVVF